MGSNTCGTGPVYGAEPIFFPMPCTAKESIPQQVLCIMSYEGSMPDMFINYFLHCINLVACVIVLGNCIEKRNHALASWCFVWVFQIALCLILKQFSGSENEFDDNDNDNCAGISIVWCAMAGWILKETSFGRTARGPLWMFLVVANVAVLVYYLIVEEFITTVAHFCAIILGVLLSFWGSTSSYSKKAQQD